MANRRGRGEGGIDRSGEGSWRLRWRSQDGQRHTKVFPGSRMGAVQELRRLVHSVDTGEHVTPTKTTFGQWTDQWLALKERTTETGTAERYARVLKIHVVPVLGSKPLQRITATDLDRLYADLENTLSARSMTLLHVVVKS